MKISNIDQKANQAQLINQLKSQTPADKNERGKEVDQKSPSSDKVDLSVRAKEMQRVHEALQMTPDVRTEKVSAIKKQIEEGTYQVDSQTLAEKMIKESLIDLIK